jgi:hypothetical protein
MKNWTISVRKTGIAASLVITFYGFAAAQSPRPLETGIEGIISIAPVRPGPVRDDMPGSAPLPNVAFTVEGDNGPVASFTTDEQGRFRVLLKPGRYKVSLKEHGRIRGCGPVDIEVESSRMTKVEWQCDTGMR